MGLLCPVIHKSAPQPGNSSVSRLGNLVSEVTREWRETGYVLLRGWGVCAGPLSVHASPGLRGRSYRRSRGLEAEDHEPAGHDGRGRPVLYFVSGEASEELLGRRVVTAGEPGGEGHRAEWVVRAASMSGSLA